MNFFVLLEVRGDGQFYFQCSFCDWLDMYRQFQFGEQMYIFMDSFFIFWYSDEFFDFQRIKVIEAFKGKVFFFDFFDDFNGYFFVFELFQWIYILLFGERYKV